MYRPKVSVQYSCSVPSTTRMIHVFPPEGLLLVLRRFRGWRFRVHEPSKTEPLRQRLSGRALRSAAPRRERRRKGVDVGEMSVALGLSLDPWVLGERFPQQKFIIV